MKRLMLIVNPKSGKGRGEKVKDSIVDVFRKHGWESIEYITERRGHATEFARDHGTGYELLVCVGGDGTLSEVMNGLMMLPKDARPTVGYIPLGTANDVASSLHLSKKPEKAAEMIMTGTPMELDIGTMGDKAFTYIIAFGAFTDVPFTTPQKMKNILGHLAYVIEGASRIPSIETYRVKTTYDDGEAEGDYLFGCIMNTMSVGGIVKFDPATVGLSDGYFEVILVKKPPHFTDYAKIVASVLSGKFDNENIVFIHTKKVRFQIDRLASWTRDGEDGGLHDDVTSENICRAVKIIIPGE